MGFNTVAISNFSLLSFSPLHLSSRAPESRVYAPDKGIASAEIGTMYSTGVLLDNRSEDYNPT
jgi:hypothetical protein